MTFNISEHDVTAYIKQYFTRLHFTDLILGTDTDIRTKQTLYSELHLEKVNNKWKLSHALSHCWNKHSELITETNIYCNW